MFIEVYIRMPPVVIGPHRRWCSHLFIQESNKGHDTPQTYCAI